MTDHNNNNNNNNSMENGLFLLFLVTFLGFLFMAAMALHQDKRADTASAAVECYRAPSQRDRCLCLTRVAAKDSNFDKHAEEACKEVP
jgi:hypothetical protein